MDLAGTALSNSSGNAGVLVLRKALDAEQTQAQALLKVLPPPPPLPRGQRVDVYA
jgi:Putative motility protein